MIANRFQRGIRLLLTVISVCGVHGATAEDRLIYPGAILSVTGPSGAVGAFSTNLAGVPSVSSFNSSKIGRRVIFLSEKRPPTISASGVSIASASSASLNAPIQYSRKNDLCKRAKTRRLMAQLGGHARCTPDWALFVSALPDGSPLALSNDPGLFYQYGLAKMRVPMVWPRIIGGSQSLVMVIDSGVDYTHPDLRANMWINPREIAGNRIDDDGNGYIDDVHGINTFANTGNPMDDNGHGTHVAGIIGAVGNNSVGTVGASWKTRIIAAKFVGASGSGPTSGAIKALNYALALKKAGHNITVTNNSWGGGPFDPALFSAISEASAAGILFVAAAGNDSTNIDKRRFYPASYESPNVISVGSTDDKDQLSAFSNYGENNVDIAAPGSEIMSTLPRQKWGVLSGTSMAAPQVAGVAMLVQAICPGRLSMLNLKRALLENGKQLQSLVGKVTNGAFMDAPKSLELAETLCSSTAPGGTFTPEPAEGAPPPAQGTEVPRWTPVPTKAPTPTKTPTRTITPTWTPTPTRTPRPTATPTPRNTPVPSSTPTPLPTPTPIPRASLKIPSISYAAGSTVPIEISKGSASIQRYSLRITVRDNLGGFGVCPQEPTVSMPQQVRNLSLKLSSPAEKFSSISVNLKGDGKSLGFGSISLSAATGTATPEDVTSLCEMLKAQIN